ncbi:MULTISPECIES: LacI family DNA-binding transcriptional regulator [Klebsiella]|uniref:LacI family DNA-binding transcriptional regulator n=1 Tax=Klebsiella quasipneumoniae subsp. quasipneumoniae TaxID=1667327 RepID=A0AAW8XRD7_9ENTR|nr:MULTISPECIES: LacI family DNA-binding transcriptional regulator [Klebsiella]MBM5553033.1 LacI family transcriptional regulator [Klebsiella quasipneumoniae]MBM5559109.1 LacI family transcriptional regulator [Klebsiella quasipneumoniae]MCF8597854.1 LacI family transcriptional regulator [Klebsiella sp. 2019SCSN059]MCJ4451481.1 LacI family transcriptional regulator [Klebsiella quasipneumoniae]MCU8824049.1 LacI family transcriptional regulator [Klebsiella quasipneumoniae]
MNIKELAEYLNLSTATVSKALNNKSDISSHTREKVLKAAETLGYRPNASARHLRSGKVGVVALLLPVAKDGNVHTASFFMRIARGLQASLKDSGIDPVIHVTTDRQGEHQLLRKIVEQNRADAVILTDTRIVDERILLLNDLQFPFVTMGQSRAMNGLFNWVDFYHEDMGRQCVRFALCQGAKRIAIATLGPDSMHGQQFLDGCLHEMRECGLTPGKGLVFFGTVDELSGEKAVQQFMLQEIKPDFIIFINDFLLMGASHYLRSLNVGSLDDQSMICATASSDFSSRIMSSTCLFTVDHEEVGRCLGEAVLRVVAGDREHRSVLINLPANLVN